MVQPTPTINLKRAYLLTKDVDQKLKPFWQHAMEHEAGLNQIDSVQSFFGSLRSGGSLNSEKAQMVSDMELAAQEIARCATADPTATITIEGEGTVSVQQIMSVAYELRGRLETIWGSRQQAKHYFLESLKIVEYDTPYFLLGAIYEDEYNPTQAKYYYEKCLEIDPDGEMCIEALRGVNRLKNYKKRFRGSWGTFFVLLILVWPGAIIYFFVKRK